MQRAVSLDIQEAICRKRASSLDGVLLDEWIARDAALTAKRSRQRPELQRLLEAASSKRCPFDVLIVDDTSRLARRTSDALRLVESLVFNGVRVIFVCQNIDSADIGGFKTALTVHAMIDEQQNARLGYKVHEGMKATVERGYSTGSKLFGYDNVREVKSGFHEGRSGLHGVRQVINSEEAALAVRIFESFANGRGIYQIALELNVEGQLGPRKASHKARHAASWRGSTIGKMLVNEKYRGQIIWNKTKVLIDPHSDAVVIRPKPEEEPTRTLSSFCAPSTRSASTIRAWLL